MTQVDEMMQVREGPEVEVGTAGSGWWRKHHLFWYVLGGAALVWLLTGYFQIEAGQVGLVERMGTLLPAPVEPGAHYGMPWPIDVVHRVPSDKQALTVTVTDFNKSREQYEGKRKEWLDAGVQNAVIESWLDPYLITADHNIVHAEAVVQYYVVEPVTFFLAVSHGQARTPAEMAAEREALVKQMASHALITEMARTEVDEALFSTREHLQLRLQATMQEMVERLRLGIRIYKMNVSTVRCPASVDGAFQEMIRAKAEKKAAEIKAEAEKQAIVLRATQGESQRMLSEAQGYKARIIDEAKGEADRFRQIYEKYQAAPELMRMSLYTDAMDTVLKNVTRVTQVPAGTKTVLTVEPAPEERQPVDRPGAEGR